jgi:hypothetical protein
LGTTPRDGQEGVDDELPEVFDGEEAAGFAAVLEPESEVLAAAPPEPDVSDDPDDPEDPDDSPDPPDAAAAALPAPPEPAARESVL